MTSQPEHKTKAQEAGEDPHGFTEEDFESEDAYLEMLMTFIVGPDDSSLDSSAGVTLTVSGTTVSGDLISFAQWGSLFVANLTEASESLGKAIGGVHDSVIGGHKKLHEEREALNLDSRARRFIHLKNVVINPGQDAMRMPIWRGKLSDVSGWSLGRAAWTQD